VSSSSPVPNQVPVAPVVPGWHGKLPTLGDFASRRLDSDFLEPWDEWLAASLLALRQARPERWLADYLASPSWRFLLCPGALPGPAGRQGWAGVLMPSVDRVGRYFPLTLVRPLGQAPASSQQMAGLWHWLARLDELAGDALHDDWTLARLEEELARMAAPDLSEPSAAAAVAEVPPSTPGRLQPQLLPGAAGDAALAIGLQAQALWRKHAQGRSYWYASTDLLGRQLLLAQGLPTPTEAVALLAATL
jgi:type VI secretion system protein ImpM